ncbi:hypothetical protein HYFRA_00013072 [Hymenoscyphus fraxineus]|uniref:Extracellular membrane protein CFEM domain-containing protein n=1 Tax=Hymenoscyphus fraxineus TaxID=746836 RepID=A0A9N9PZ33_9HELO|nr:hypothetical protein HYFRA_00013072 [Hymenoscyphus fraxineus]
MMSHRMFVALPILSQVLVVNAAGFAEVLLRDVLLPRSPAGALIGDAVGIFDGSPIVQVRALPSACNYVYSAIDYCSSVSPGWISAPEKTQATCLCYSSTSWIPSVFDSSVSSCAQYVKTVDPQDYSVIANLGGFCSSAGNVRGNNIATSTRTPTSPTAASTTTAPSSLSPSPAITPGPTTARPPLSAAPGCSTVSRILGSCISLTKGFTDLPAHSQASCLCYTSSTYAPGNFDDNVQTCASFVSTATPTAYPVFSALQSFCGDEGDVRGGVVSGSASGSARQTTAVLSGAGISAFNDGGGPTDPGATTTVASTPAPPPNNGPVTVTGGLPVPTVLGSGAGREVSGLSNMVLGIGSVALSVFLFL